MTYLLPFACLFAVWSIFAFGWHRIHRESVPPESRIKRTELCNLEPIMCQGCGRPSWVVPGPVLMCRECAAEDAELNELIGL